MGGKKGGGGPGGGAPPTRQNFKLVGGFWFPFSFWGPPPGAFFPPFFGFSGVFLVFGGGNWWRGKNHFSPPGKQGFGPMSFAQRGAN
eukprot:FR742598.1.p2 GENE.FR742598.1~~FR742598.1.p2  ORF type:complete len:102 (-),score=65.55 FR742598.1:964-1224(-)